MINGDFVLALPVVPGCKILTCGVPMREVLLTLNVITQCIGGTALDNLVDLIHRIQPQVCGQKLCTNLFRVKL